MTRIAFSNQPSRRRMRIAAAAAALVATTGIGARVALDSSAEPARKLPAQPGVATGVGEHVALDSRAASTSKLALKPIAAGTPWKRLAKAPIAGRVGAGVVWTGTEMVVWGGVDPRRDRPDLADGAAYNPRTGTWRKLAPAPTGMHGVVESAVWTGTKAFFWTADWTSGDEGRAAALYDPRTNTWRSLPRGPLGGRQMSSTIWTGTEALILSGVTGDGFPEPVGGAIDPNTGRWRLFPALNRLTGLAVGSVWSGHEAYLMGDRYQCTGEHSRCENPRPVFLEYEPEHDRLRTLSLDGAPGAHLWPLAWAAGRVLFTDSYDEDRLVSYAPSSRRWAEGARRQCRHQRGYWGEQSAWIEGRFVVGCARRAVQIYASRSDSWRTIRTTRSPLSSDRAGSAIVWTGEELIVWSGTLNRRENPMAQDGYSIELPS
jgi:hypothetical protein